jgi:AraC family transcriptional regulator
MKISVLDHIQHTAEYIEENIKQDLSLESISWKMELSKFYLNRIFSALTGKTLMAYVNSRKLVSSLNELLNTDLRILDIACEYGFNFENSFIRAFKREFGITPDVFRKTKTDLPITTPITANILSVMGENALLIKPLLLFKPAFWVTGDRIFAHYGDDLGNFNGNFHSKRKQLIHNVIEPNIHYGHCLYTSSNTSLFTACTKVKQETALNKNSSTKLPDGMVTFQIPSHNYLVFKYIKTENIYPVLWKDFEHVFQLGWNYLKQAGFAEPAFHFEKMDFRNIKESYFELDLYFPCD